MAGDFQPEAVIAVLEQVKNVYGDSAKKISESIMSEFSLPRRDIMEELNLYPYYYQVLLAYEYSDLSPKERMVLKILGYLFGYSHRIDYEKNQFQEYYVMTRSFGNKDYFGMYYLERNQPFDEESFTNVKANLLKFLGRFKRVQLIRMSGLSKFGNKYQSNYDLSISSKVQLKYYFPLFSGTLMI